MTRTEHIIVLFTKHPGFDHVNALGDHRYHYEKDRSNKLPNTRPPVDVNTYIVECTADGMLEVGSYAGTENNLGHNALINSTQKAWSARWGHS